MIRRAVRLRFALAILGLVAAGAACKPAPSTESGNEARASGDGKGPRTPVPTRRPRVKTGCLADKLPTLLAYGGQSPDCKDAASDRCSTACLSGDAAACYDRGMATGHDAAGDAVSDKMFRKACELGMAIGCTNYAASMWARDETASLDCARRIFEKTCAANETWGCGMLGRMLIDDDAAGKEELTRGRAVLERACEELGSFSCRALAMELEGGKLGPYKQARIRKLLARACETGDQDGCGRPKSAGATFRKVSHQK